MKFLSLLFIVLTFSSLAQSKIKIVREDNRLLFFQVGTKNDTVIKNKMDLFLIHIPDSIKKHTQLFVTNGQFMTVGNDSIYKLKFVSGMKYSHSKPDSVFNTLVEGNTTRSKVITVKLNNTATQKTIFTNTFFVK